MDGLCGNLARLMVMLSLAGGQGIQTSLCLDSLLIPLLYVSSIERMNCLHSFPNLHLSTDFVHNYSFFPPLKIQHSTQSFSSTPYLHHRKKCFSVASNSSTSLRRRTNYQPSSWDDTQIQSLNTSSFTGDVHEKRREKLKEDVKLLIKEKSFADQLELFDSLQKLGVAYHFEEEIKYLLNLMKFSEEKLRMEFNEDIHVMALYFRLSREHGFEVSKDLLVKSYKDENGCFKPFVFHNIKGILSLYEASFLAMDGEDEIDDAMEFALKHLNDFMRSNLSENPLLAQHIAIALELPLHHRILKFQAQMFIEHSRHIKEINVDPIVLELGQLDFNMTQNIYKRELKEISMWWTKISNVFDGKLNFAREWPMESYFLAVGMAVEPQFSTCRKELAKALCFINVIDDIYDIYGLLDELQLFTDVVDRWDFATSKPLPEYMKICLLELFNTVNSLSCKIMEEKGLDILPYLKRAWLDLCKAYMVEARWYYIGYSPTFEEYLDNAWISVSAPLVSVMALCLSDNLTNFSLESFDFYPNIIRQSSIIFRLYNDLGTSKGELQRGDVSKSIQCYMKEKHVSELEAQEFIRNIINKYWKELNREWIKGLSYEETFKMVAINLPRAAHLFYLQSNGENIGELNIDKMKDNVISLLLEPITFNEGD
ncbi:terpene synthase 10-like [Dendrobium catenatum]|uniref:terpene synthase 10-like n=1 Tax=Dendrobium catenatum TaxID=906689 RepID=UPI00109FF7DE|nr:terpene synthase 10-like [Dendrobium catenatum]